MTLIRELIEIPEHIQRGDYVLKLAEAVNRPEETVGQYVATPELGRCFDDALSFIRSALESRTSKAAYLHGSFGSGKSHFMAILHLILLGNPAARSIHELAGVITKHNEWTQGKRFLLVPYHMIGAANMEQGILGRYTDFVRAAHPQAAIPGVYLAEGLFRDAQSLRRRMGDDAFFATLNEGGGEGSGWGDLAAGWDDPRFEAALAAGPGSEERTQLVSTLVGTFFQSYDLRATVKGEAYVPLDKGLAIISRHAADLGYDVLLLFLDELILWLASHATERKFILQEAQKLAKLVEAQSADRPIPIVSFVARQRDLRELVGENVPGAEALNFSDSLGWQEGRFHTITLEDRNLPAIAEKRVLKCRTDAARKELDAAFQQTAKIRESVMNTLLTSEGDRGMFRKVYPFSPALVQTLIALSSMLQRERTALKVMVQLLVDQRDTLQVGDLVPVGDLFDVIAHGDEALTPQLAVHFENAKRLYHQKLLPALEQQHGRREELEKLPYDDPKRTAFRADDRLVKTLLLSALAGDVEALRGLNGERLAALNHGTIRTPVEGREGQEVLRRCKQWATAVGEIRIGEEANPTISVQLTGVDTESIIEQARREDNLGNRIRRVRQMLFEQLGIAGEGEFELYHEFAWRNTKRSCVVLFKNVRELLDESLEASEQEWKLVIDFPFDEEGFGPRDDLGRLQEFRLAHPEGTRTLVWLPSFLSPEAEKDLGMLVILEHALSGEWFGKYSSHLSPQDRQTARSVLESQGSMLVQRVQSHLEAAYGLEAILLGSLDTVRDLEPTEQFQTLLHGFQPRPPVAANLRGAMDNLLDQALSHEFPAHPKFEVETKMSNLRKVCEQVSQAARTKDGRAPVDKPLRPLLRGIAGPLLLGEMAYDATHFVLGHHWRSHFARKAAETGCALTVDRLRQWIDEPQAMGLPKEVANLVILVFAEQTNRSFLLHGAAFDASLTNMPEACELREEMLPEPQLWEIAVYRAGKIFGEAPSPLLKASNVSLMASRVKEQAAAAREPCQAYCRRLTDRLAWAKVSGSEADRSRTATTTLKLMERLQSVEPREVVATLASAEIATSEDAMGTCFRKASELAGHLEVTNWEIFEAIDRLRDERQAKAAKIRQQVTAALASDEHVIELAPALSSAQSQAVRLLTETVAPPEPKPGTKVKPPVPRGKRTVDEDTQDDLDLAAAQDLLAELKAKMVKDQTIRLRIGWRIEEGGADE